ncbi:hypothetical protein AAHY28_17210 [Klebsiella variicola subsp. variicola]|uniref:Uncharacterized protein n=1 Tax=Raoultella ornithinolytica TaxID=54291 RepID=A0ABZ2DNT4_RAOOR|nr:MULTISPECIES: hypothetical protein [Klebsiella/Raoultella group]DAT42208.1 MAG TPA: hypothetical protein [Caudoviricetes sp.]HAT2282238.1 hypothetical protein [Raoultella ornithinolytica]HBT2454947.1 hypothetical protein [Klebsiella aerogenes]KLU50247.1 hypothetical protein ABE97_06705 [Klebsiella michiganensis]KLU51725.1 hypothetical protein ABE84_02620 [Klebsiella michiganensis]
MKATEPKIIAPSSTEEEVISWMERKISASHRLKTAIAEREALKQSIEVVDQLIDELTIAAALEL